MIIPDIHHCIEETVRPCVQKGAAWLDENHPGWAQKIAPSKLDISSSSLCICGQVFGDYSQRPDGAMESENLGFSLPDLDLFETLCICCQEPIPYLHDSIQQAAWKALDRLWLDEVYWRVS